MIKKRIAESNPIQEKKRKEKKRVIGDGLE
jgi:hypothetical protein